MPVAVYPSDFKIILTKSVLKHLNLRLKKLKLRLIADRASILLAADQFLRIFRNELFNSQVIQNVSKKGSTGPLTGIKSLADAETHPLFGMLGFSSAPSVNAIINNIRIGSQSVVFKTRKTPKGFIGDLIFDFNAFNGDTAAKISWNKGSVSWPRILEYGISIGNRLFGWWIDSNASRSQDGIMIRNKNHSGFAIVPLYIFRTAFERAMVITPIDIMKKLSVRFVG